MVVSQNLSFMACGRNPFRWHVSYHFSEYRHISFPFGSSNNAKYLCSVCSPIGVLLFKTFPPKCPIRSRTASISNAKIDRTTAFSSRLSSALIPFLDCGRILRPNFWLWFHFPSKNLSIKLAGFLKVL